MGFGLTELSTGSTPSTGSRGDVFFYYVNTHINGSVLILFFAGLSICGHCLLTKTFLN